MINRAFIGTLLLIIWAGFNPQLVSAIEVPNFPGCTNPQGVVKAQYNEGTHGIAGDMSSYSGKDTVYQLTDEALLQCFCSSDGKGIQTNWWKVSSLTEDEIQSLKNQGWVLIPNGALWGLQQAPYLAKNSEYSCTGSTNTSQASANNSNSQGTTVTTGNILGLATTGNIREILLLSTLGVLLVLSGLITKKLSQK